MHYDELWPGGLRLIRSDDAFRLGTDAVLLSAFAGTVGVNRVCDLGSGSGIIALLLAWENRNIRAEGIEIQPKAVLAARENIKLNGLADRVSILEGDLRCHRTMQGAGAFDLVVSNPPYFPVSSGRSPDEESAATAREERTCTLRDVCTAAAYFTRWGGKFAVVHRPERLSELFCAMTDSGIEPKRLRFVENKLGSVPSLVLVEGRRGGKPGLTIEQPLVLCGEDGGDTYEVRRIYHRYQDRIG